MNKHKVLYISSGLISILNIIYSQSSTTTGSGTVLNLTGITTLNTTNTGVSNWLINYAPLLYHLSGSFGNYIIYLITIVFVLFYTIFIFISRAVPNMSEIEHKFTQIISLVLSIAIVHYIFTFLPAFLMIGLIFILVLLALFSRFLGWTHKQTRFIRKAIKKMTPQDFRYLSYRFSQPMNNFRRWLLYNDRQIMGTYRTINNDIYLIKRSTKRIKIKDKKVIGDIHKTESIIKRVEREFDSINKEFNQIVSDIKNHSTINTNSINQLPKIKDRIERLKHKIKLTSNDINNEIKRLKNLKNHDRLLSGIIQNYINLLSKMLYYINSINSILNSTEGFENSITNFLNQYAKVKLLQSSMNNQTTINTNINNSRQNWPYSDKYM